ncbi:MAG: class II fructose-bisphosphate aldolase [bacterium]
MSASEAVEDIKSVISGVLEITPEGGVRVIDEGKLRADVIDTLAPAAAFPESDETKEAARWLIRGAGDSLGIRRASIHDLYMAMGRGETGSFFTVPAINIRGLTFDVSRAIFRAAKRLNVGALLCEIARSEIGYTEQRPAEYAMWVTAGAIKEGWGAPIFIQGDHFQVNAKKYAADPEAEVGAVRGIIQEALEAGFYNIDVDTSTLVDLSKESVSEQQRANFERAAELTKHIRDLEPPGVTVSVGGEIGEVGKKNSTVEEFRAFIEGFNSITAGLPGLSKISIQTGTSHGGVVLPDGSIAEVNIDFEALEKIGAASQKEFGLCGAVQHGASTLPNEVFDKFPKVNTGEIHLATGFQNMIYDDLPGDLLQKIHRHLDVACANERKESDTDEQFYYKTRKKAFGAFKKELCDLPAGLRESIGARLEEQFAFLMKKLNVVNTREVVDRTVKPAPDPLGPVPAGLR